MLVTGPPGVLILWQHPLMGGIFIFNEKSYKYSNIYVNDIGDQKEECVDSLSMAAVLSKAHQTNLFHSTLTNFLT